MAKRLAILTIAGLGVLAAATAMAAEPDIVTVRKAGMDLAAGNFGFIRTTVASKGDVKPLASAGKALASWAKAIPLAFPAGTDKGDTKALAAIWSDSAGFKKDAMALGDAATRLAAAAKAGDAATVAVEAKAVGEACGACHRGYRAK